MFATLSQALRNAVRGCPRRVLFIDDITAGDIEIRPASEADWCREQMTAIARDRQTPRSGLADATVRRPRAGAVNIADLAIPLGAAKRALAGNLAAFDAVVTGDPNQPTRTVGIGYGPSPLSAVAIYAADGSDKVTAVEVSLRGNPLETIAVLSAIAAVPARQPLIAADWAGLGVAELADPAAIARFAHRTE
jgi:hypothetical protein